MSCEQWYNKSIMKTEKYSKPTTLYSLIVLTESLKNLEKTFNSFIGNPHGDKGFIYMQNRGYIFALSHLEDFPETPSEYLLKISNIMKLTDAFGTLMQKCKENKNNFSLREQTKKCINMMYRESLSLSIEEINSCNFKEKLKTLEGDTFASYVKFILDFEKTQFRKGIIPFMREIKNLL